ncbi:MAG: hypothetical protein KAH17_01150 [Bacteroidales bacterium]|nr:hypothetical protein [Bacteroidales bacterium]
MNNTTLGFFIGITLCFCIWFLNSVVNSKETITENTAFITIINKSDFNIKKALLEHGCGELTVSDIGIGKTGRHSALGYKTIDEFKKINSNFNNVA